MAESNTKMRKRRVILHRKLVSPSKYRGINVKDRNNLFLPSSKAMIALFCVYTLEVLKVCK